MRAKKIFIVIICVVLGLIIFFSGREFEKETLGVKSRHGYIIPDARAVKIACLGFSNLASDFFAVQAVNSLYVSNEDNPEYWKNLTIAFREYLKNPHYHGHAEKTDVMSFSRYAYVSIYLDPHRVERIRIFTLLMTWLFDFPDGSIPILEYVSRENPDKGEFSYYLAMNYLIHKRDKEKAIYWLKKSAMCPDTIPAVRGLLVGLLSEGDTKENIILALEGLSETIDNEEIKQTIKERIKHIKDQGSQTVDWDKISEKMKEVVCPTCGHHHEHGHDHHHHDHEGGH